MREGRGGGWGQGGYGRGQRGTTPNRAHLHAELYLQDPKRLACLGNDVFIALNRNVANEYVKTHHATKRLLERFKYHPSKTHAFICEQVSTVWLITFCISTFWIPQICSLYILLMMRVHLGIAVASVRSNAEMVSSFDDSSAPLSQQAQPQLAESGRIAAN